MNLHVDTEFQFPPGWSEGDKILALVEFWMRFQPEVRKKFIEHHCSRSHLADIADGAIEAVLRGLQQVDLEKLRTEVAKQKRGGDLENSIREARIRCGKDPDPNRKPGEPAPGDRVVVLSGGTELFGVLKWRGEKWSSVKLDVPQGERSLQMVHNMNTKKIPGGEE
jgi:hypothetical protein